MMKLDELPPEFDPSIYLELHPDVAAAGVDPADHYLRHGHSEGRSIVRTAPSPLSAWNKVHLMGVLSAALGLTRYLEITTTLTGGLFGAARELRFAECRRLIYRASASELRDDLPVDFCAAGEDIQPAATSLRNQGDVFDLILVDPHHTYDCSIRDIQLAFEVLSKRGVIVVHDCNPRSREIAAPEFRAGEWCGATFEAFIDFTLGNSSIEYFTIDMDTGCGIIMKPRNLISIIKTRLRSFKQRRLVREWQMSKGNYERRFEYFCDHRSELLRLGSFDLLRYKLSGIRI